MDEEDNRPRRQAITFPRPLVALSIEELEVYLQDLGEERARVEAEIRRKRDVRGAADALFKMPPQR